MGLELLVLQTRKSTNGINEGDSVSSLELFLCIKRIRRADLESADLLSPNPQQPDSKFEKC
jgi:hypothetical protein